MAGSQESTHAIQDEHQIGLPNVTEVRKNGTKERNGRDGCGKFD